MAIGKNLSGYACKIERERIRWQKIIIFSVFFSYSPWFPFFKCAIIQDIRYGVPVNSGERKGVQNDWAILIRIITSDFYSV